MPFRLHPDSSAQQFLAADCTQQDIARYVESFNANFLTTRSLDSRDGAERALRHNINVMLRHIQQQAVPVPTNLEQPGLSNPWAQR